MERSRIPDSPAKICANLLSAMRSADENQVEHMEKKTEQESVADIAYLMNCIFSDFISSHGFVRKHGNLQKLATEIEDQLAALYQAVWNVPN